MNDGATPGDFNIGIYVRESRDDNEENYATIETQKGLLIDYVKSTGLGNIFDIYMDDNVSGSAFERAGLGRLKNDVENGRINLLLLKDLSRLGRNNAKTLLFLDYLEEKGVRVMTFDGRYDSTKDNETLGIETWINERYVRDISRKIRASLRFKIKKGEYIGRAPYGYKKSIYEKNRLCIDEEKAEIVRMIFLLYSEGNGYSSIAGMLNEKDLKAPGGGLWNCISVRRILCNRVYTGDTVQGVSEKISFKSHKTRRLQQSEWVVTENTHAAIIEKDVFNTVQVLREERNNRSLPAKSNPHVLSGLMVCGRCGSPLYARSREKKQIFYVCGRYYKYGRKSCTSHFIWEKAVLDIISAELIRFLDSEHTLERLKKHVQTGGLPGKDNLGRLQKLEQTLISKKKQQEMLYMDRLEERISSEMFVKMNKVLDERICILRGEIEKMVSEIQNKPDYLNILAKMKQSVRKNGVTYEIARCMVNRITVYDSGDDISDDAAFQPEISGLKEKGLIIVDFKINKVYD